MLPQILTELSIVTMMMAVTIIIQALFTVIALGTLQHQSAWVARGYASFKLAIIMALTGLWLLVSLGIAVWLWAFLFMILGVFDTVATSLYFSIVSFTTLGFGDIIIEGRWRLLSGFVAANGLILFSLSTAFMIEVMRRLHEIQSRQSDKD